MITEKPCDQCAAEAKLLVRFGEKDCCTDCIVSDRIADAGDIPSGLQAASHVYAELAFELGNTPEQQLLKSLYLTVQIALRDTAVAITESLHAIGMQLITMREIEEMSCAWVYQNQKTLKEAGFASEPAWYSVAQLLRSRCDPTIQMCGIDPATVSTPPDGPTEENEGDGQTAGPIQANDGEPTEQAAE